MAYQVLYRTYRPQNWSDVVGQDYIVKTLVNAIKNNKIAHAYLFAGPRGTGKTSIAKLFAKAINCEHFDGEACQECSSCKAYVNNNNPDIIELDAASNNSVDNIREIIEQVPYAPLVGKYKVYIIDEAHMLSASAFNALLKTLEEPPAHVIFILATTDPQKVIPTVLSRCQRYNFSKISNFDIKKRIIEVLNKENITYDEKAVEELARMAEGGMRDALSLLEQCLAYNPDRLELEDVEKIFGLTATSQEVELYLKIHNSEISDAITSLRKMYERGTDCKRLAIDILEIIKDALIYSDQGKENLLSRININEAQEIIDAVSVEELLHDAKELEDIISKEKQNQNFLVYLELCFVKMATKQKQIQPVIEEKKIKQEIVEEKQTETNTEDEQELQQDINTDSFVVEPETEFLLKILLDANKDLKISDQIIYNKLDLYIYEPEKRKFYQLLIGTELFASNKDAIIISGNKLQADNINTKANNIDLYNFLNTEFGIDKMVYAVDENKKKQLIELYKNTPAQERNKPVYVEKYQAKKTELSSEEKLFNLFGNSVKVEE